MKLIGFFSGVGGIELGFEQAGFKPIWSNEFDEKARETFEENFKHELSGEDITNLEITDLPNDYDVVVGGFPCQAFSIAGYQKGFEDERGTLFFDMIRLTIHTRPRVYFVENVKNFKHHDKGNTYRVVKETFEQHGYKVTDMIMNSSEYGDIPQGRERIYMIAFREQEDYDKFTWPKPIEPTIKFQDLLEKDDRIDEKYYYSRFSFYPILKEDMTRKDRVYQWRRKYVRENKSGVCPTLTANMGTGGHNVPLILTDRGIRKLTPRETFNLQGYPKDYKLPLVADGHLYKQAGNSVTVPVIKRIADEIYKAIHN